MTEVHSLILTMLIPLITFIGIGLTILVQYRIQKKTRHDQAMFYALDQCNKFVGAVHAYSDAIVQTGIASLGYANGYIDYANSTQYNLVPEHKEAIEKVLTTDLSNRAMVLERNHAIQAQQAYTYSTLASYLLLLFNSSPHLLAHLLEIAYGIHELKKYYFATREKSNLSLSQFPPSSVMSPDEFEKRAEEIRNQKIVGSPLLNFKKHYSLYFKDYLPNK